MMNRVPPGALLAAVAVIGISGIAPVSRGQSSAPPSQKIILPMELVAGQPATLAVLDSDGHVAAGVRLVFSSGEVVTTDESGRAHFLAPPDAGVMFARIVGGEIREAADTLPRDADAPAGLQITPAPKPASLQNRIVIRGSGFQGDADRNRVSLSGRSVLVLASSPVELILAPLANFAPGRAALTIGQGAGQTSAELTLVQIISSNSGDQQVRRGKKIKVLLRVQGTSEPVQLEVRNLTPWIVQFPHGDEMSVRTSGGSENSAAVEMRGKSAGAFSFSVSLENNLLNANMPVARDFLEAALKIAPADAASRIQHILENLRDGNADGAAARKELRKISESAGSRDFQALLRATRRALYGD
jgi:hypothetical protein